MILTILTPMIGVLGALLLSFGVWMVYHPAGYIAGGLLCLLWSWLMAKYLSSSTFKGGK
ncbi:TPA: hypothetical protein ACSW2U_001700 [Enterobacter roggenkampii]|uniref:hypothetical protein n=1 Tax=Enterobacter roggenkampii TaxID=1812935 RepID=UPI002448289F|nr:hypothetical protein [Enterobacter roggenkampii]MDH0518336.1 hypothetical protein [Enterobacter roggenkampii]